MAPLLDYEEQLTKIIVWYMNQRNEVDNHIIENNMPGLVYQDLLSEPIEVKRIMRNGLVIGRTSNDGSTTRSGMFIPANRIICIDFADDYTG